MVTGPLSIHNKAKTSSITTPERISQSNFFFIFNIFGNFVEFVRVVPQAPIFLFRKKLKDLYLKNNYP